MSNASLTEKDWLDRALTCLRDEGYGALRALPLAKSLGVTRGSFYHHFDSLEAFHVAVIAHWATASSGEVIREAEAADDPRRALDTLLQTTLRSGAGLERAVRAWATVKEPVAREVEKVDARRIAVARGLLISCGVAEDAATVRAQVLYWAAIGRLMLPFPEKAVLTRDEISAFAALMTLDDITPGAEN